MKIIHFIIIFLFVTVELAYSAMSTSQIAKKYLPLVVTIIALDENDQPLSLGSGFFINKSGDIATNYHVLEGSSKAIIKTINGDKGNILEIIKYDPFLDLLVAKTTFNNIEPLRIGNSDDISIGDDIIAIGNPAGLEGTVSKGIISGIRKVEKFKFIQITAPISPGSSGGPIFNIKGQVIGIATSYLDTGQNLNFAMPVNYLKTLKSNITKLAALPKKKTRIKVINDRLPVELFERQDVYLTFSVFSEFSIRNHHDYPINNIKLFFVYTNYRGEVVTYSAWETNSTILPKLALQFEHEHGVRNFNGYIDKAGNYHDEAIVEFNKMYNSLHKTNKDTTEDYKYIRGTVDIRILDYDIDRTSGSSPLDLLFK